MWASWESCTITATNASVASAKRADRLALRGDGDVVENERTREHADRDETIAGVIDVSNSGGEITATPSTARATIAIAQLNHS